MTAAKKAEMIRVNTAITEHKKVDKKVKSVINVTSISVNTAQRAFDSSADLADHVLTHPKDTPSKANSGSSAQSSKEYECPKCFSKYSSLIK